MCMAVVSPPSPACFMCSSTNNSYVGSDGTRSHYDYSNMHIDDKTSKVRIYPSDVASNRRGYYTDMFLLGLKKTSGINLLGFFLTTGGGRRAAANLSGVIGRYPKDSEISELKRIRYTTSHPKDMTDDLIECYKSCEKLMPFLHLPIQTGSDEILKLMNV